MRLLEARTIKSSDDIIELLQNGKLAGRLGGKKFIPDWVLTNEQELKDLVEVTLDVIGDDPNIAGDEVIQFMIKACPEDSTKWANVLEQTPDTLIELANALKADWFKKSAEWQDRLNELIEQPFSVDLWHNLEKDVQDVFAKRAAKKGKKVNNTDSLYEKLYDDGIWKVFKVKSFEGDVELASHIEPFESYGEVYNKTRWCTAADKRYYDNYTKMDNSLYVIQQWSKTGIYKKAWQIAFDRPEHIEFMDKNDQPSYNLVTKAPREALETIKVDNEDSLFVDCSLAELFDITPKVTKIYSDGSLKKDAIDRLLPKENGMTITRHNGLVSFENSDMQSEVLTIPESITNLDTITSLRGCQYFKKVIIKAHVSTIDNTFYGSFPSVEEFVLPEGLKNIPTYAFRYLRDLTRVNIPSTVREIGEYSFSCTGIQEVEIPEGVTTIQPYAFSDCKNLKQVYLPSTLKEIQRNAFIGCKSLQHIDLPEGLEIIGSTAFHTTGLTEITIPSTVKTIGGSCFYGDKDLTSVNVKVEDFEDLGSGIFTGCSNLEYIDGIEKFAGSKNAFEGTKISLESTLGFAKTFTQDMFKRLEKSNFKLGDNYEKISRYALARSESLETFTSGKSLIAIQEQAFNGSAVRVVDLSGSPNLVVIGQQAFLNCRNLEKIILPENLEEIQYAAFNGCSNLKEIVLPNKVRRIAEHCFSNCTALETVKLPRRLQKIGKEAFYNCSNLQNIELPSTLTRIDSGAFERCTNLIQIEIPHRVTEISERVFAKTGLTNVTITDNIQDIKEQAFFDCKNLMDIEVSNVDNDEDFDQYEDIDYATDAFENCPYEEVLKAAGVFDKRKYNRLLSDD